MVDDDDNEKFEIIFAPGAFDDFDGTQEELDEVVAEIKRLIETGGFFEQARPLTLEDLAELPDGFIDELSDRIENFLEDPNDQIIRTITLEDPNDPPHTLH